MCARSDSSHSNAMLFFFTSCMQARLKGALLEGTTDSGVFPEEMHFVCLGCDEPLMDGANAVQIGDDAAYVRRCNIEGCCR